MDEMACTSQKVRERTSTRGQFNDGKQEERQIELFGERTWSTFLVATELLLDFMKVSQEKFKLTHVNSLNKRLL